MIIPARSTRLSFSADAVAHIVRSAIAAPAASIAARRDEPLAASAPLDLGRLYPALFAQPAPRQPLPIRAIRGLAFRLSVVGSTAAMIAILHHL